MVLMGVREGREREIKCLNENILSQHHHRNENLAQGFFLPTEMLTVAKIFFLFLGYKCLKNHINQTIKDYFLGKKYSQSECNLLI